MLAAQFSRTGAPADVLEVVELPDPPAPGAGEVLVALVASPINPSDLLTIAGSYGVKPPLPAVPGYEGVGEVTVLGDGVTHLKVGDRVLLLTAPGTWRERVLLKAATLFPLPPGDDLQLAMLGANPPTAVLLLDKFVSLTPGDWVIQNAANSGVGAAVVAVARARGVRTVNVVRRESAVEDVRALGGDVVVVDGPDLTTRVHDAMQAAGGDPARLRLALDAVAGRGTRALMRCLAHGGTVVNYGGLSGEPIALDPRDLIFHETTLRGFWLVPWFRKASPSEQALVFGEVGRLVATGALRTPVEATYPLSQARAACVHAAREGRGGKVLLVRD